MANKLLTAIFGDYSKKEVRKVSKIADKVLALEEKYQAMDDKELTAQTPLLKERLANGETLDDILPDAFAVCREAAWRVLGMKHFRVQVIGGIVLHQGRIAEMKTGEGKTLVATLPAYLNALSGDGVHIVTVNDYLAKRDSEWMGKLYRFLGLKVGLIIHSKQDQERKEAYNADITYGTNNEMGFDYLRDNMVQYKENKVQRGHNFAIVDEVDSILIDEARTPLIISGKGEKSTSLYEDANRFARTLKMVKVAKMDEKQDTDETYDGDYVVDEKAKTATLTQDGVKKAEQTFGVENLMDIENTTLLHHINQAIKANGVMKRDIDYVVADGQVKIVDEFTGRIMEGRRYNEGLHQAIEAKEGVKIENESKTLATITFQNYFRLYKKLSGMTGTASTEAPEFSEIYKLDVVEIPTNKPLARIDHPDVIFQTEAGKFHNVIDQIKICHEKKQPVLVGTISIEKSELLSKYLKKAKIPHNVLNAKNHEKEAEIIAQAGKLGAVTIATNMAGRGTDIMLGGNAEYLAKAEMKRMQFTDELIAEATGFADTDNEEIINARKTFKELEEKYKESIQSEADEVREAGGLFILGTERHDSRRIDNQLRGRAGRQGDPGESQFYISCEDDLMRLFGGERMQMMMSKFSDDENMPIPSKMISKTVESSQKKVEGNHFGIRKNVLQYDDVMNRQRTLIYQQRDQVLDGIDLTEKILSMLDTNIEENVKNYLAGDKKEDWNVAGLKEKYKGWLVTEDDFNDLDTISVDETIELLTDRGHKVLDEKRTILGDEMFQDFERMVLLRNVDMLWMDHIDAMDDLKQGIHLRSYAQQDPVVAFRMESYDMFDEMTATIRENTVKTLLMYMPRRAEDVERKAVVKVTATSAGGDDTVKAEPVRKGKKVGPNDPCPCGSGKKYKKCCGAPGAQK
ncbi:MAG: preprotein translocase subunit SecA [Acetobacter sp.]|nr:preprotein translocase subunit SecA [Bacteroides sp.]MCM1340859.1 preprotein translocase subunit SecA [Acetobacter sp.]MCM1432584.1 preprotein translocase subunit SecA [Clostridiales bacterium]